jgi:hypothetical protein
MHRPILSCGKYEQDYETGEYELELCERCKDAGYCRKLAGEGIEPYFMMKIDEEEFKNILPLKIPKEKQKNNPYLIQLNEALELFHFKEYEQSLTIFKALIDDNPDNSIASYGAACCCYFTNKYDEATTFPISSSYSSISLGFATKYGFVERFKAACINKITEIEWKKEQEIIRNPYSSSSVSENDIIIDKTDNSSSIANQHFKALVKAIENKDILKVSLLLDDAKTYQDYPKGVFLNLLNQAFEKFDELGDEKLIACKGYCGSMVCGNLKKTGYRFEGNISGAYINLIFEYLGKELNDICECNDFKCKRTNINIENRIYIDPGTYSFDPDTNYNIN